MSEQQLLNQPWILYVLGGVALLGVVTARLPGILGNIGRAWSEWLDARQRIATSRDDADIREKDRTIANLTAQLALVEALREEHARWDWEVYRALGELGHPVPPPPRLP